MIRVIEYFTKSLKVTQGHSRSFEMIPLGRAFWACASPYYYFIVCPSVCRMFMRFTASDSRYLRPNYVPYVRRNTMSIAVASNEIRVDKTAKTTHNLTNKLLYLGNDKR